MSSPVIVDAPERGRFEILSDDALVGFADYVVRDGRVVFTHLETTAENEGRGLASALARGALDELRVRGVAVVPLCPFISAYIERHRDYDDLVDHAKFEQYRSRP